MHLVPLGGGGEVPIYYLCGNNQFSRKRKKIPAKLIFPIWNGNEIMIKLVIITFGCITKHKLIYKIPSNIILKYVISIGTHTLTATPSPVALNIVGKSKLL